jgi:signal transduction histidine kinase
MSVLEPRATVRHVTGGSGQGWFEADALRRLVPSAALLVALVAIVTQPSTVPDLLFAAVPVVAFAVWAFVPATSLLTLAISVIVPVVIVQRSGELEPLMFEASLLAFVVGLWSPSLRSAVPLGLLAAATPVLVALVQDPPEVAVAIWIMGIAFPWAMSRVVVRQERLSEQLEDTERRLAQQALIAERREIARDVHDFVGHGLAAVMLQVTSARHVLRRDPAAAEDALRSAEEVGRRSMQELRRTVTLLRSDNGFESPLPSVAEIPALVDQARAGGLSVELRLRGDLSSIPAGVRVAVYRIAQEALANAARHAPRARTSLGLEFSDGRVEVVAETKGPIVTSASASERERPRYGLIGMQERATALGGDFAAGPIPDGWLLTCRLPVAGGPSQ